MKAFLPLVFACFLLGVPQASLDAAQGFLIEDECTNLRSRQIRGDVLNEQELSKLADCIIRERARDIDSGKSRQRLQFQLFEFVYPEFDIPEMNR